MQAYTHAQMAACTMVSLVPMHICKWAARGHTMLAVALVPQPCANGAASAHVHGPMGLLALAHMGKQATSTCAHGQKGLLTPTCMGKWGH